MNVFSNIKVKVKHREISIVVRNDYTVEEMKQFIALKTGNILASSSFVIPLTNERLRKILYLRNILLEFNIVISDPLIFDFITEEELDGLISLFKKNYPDLDKLGVISKVDVILWKILTGQIFKVTGYYVGIDENKLKTSKILGAVYDNAGLLEQFLDYLYCEYSKLSNRSNNENYLILKWFAVNNFFIAYKRTYLKFSMSMNFISDIEAICLLVCDSFNVTNIFSVIKYFILLQFPKDNIFRTILSFRVKDYFRQRISRNNRRKILEQINNLCSINSSNFIPISDKFKSYIKALDKRLHPSDYRKLFPKAYEFFVLNRENSKAKCYDFLSSEISKMYKDKDISVIQIASLVYKRFGSFVFVNRFDSLARRAEKDRKETDILDLLIDAKLGDTELNYLESFYNRRLYKLKASQNATSIPCYPKPCANEDFINCVLDIIKFKKNG